MPPSKKYERAYLDRGKPPFDTEKNSGTLEKRYFCYLFHDNGSPCFRGVRRLYNLGTEVDPSLSCGVWSHCWLLVRYCLARVTLYGYMLPCTREDASYVTLANVNT